MTNKQNFTKFQGSKISHQEAGKVLGGGSNDHCAALEADLEEAMEAGDFREARNIRDLIAKIC